MSKVFQIMSGLCHWDATHQFPTLESTKGRFAPNIVFVEAPDYVFEGWGFDEQADGEERFIKPEAPDGWVYDDETGTFYPEGFDSNAPATDDNSSVWDELDAAYQEGVDSV